MIWQTRLASAKIAGVGQVGVWQTARFLPQFLVLCGYNGRKGQTVKLAESQIFDEIAQFLCREIGIDIGVKRNRNAQYITSFFHRKGVTDFAVMCELIKGECRQNIINILTICETYFLREINALEIFIDLVKAHDKPFTILSAPCASGDEPYSLAILLDLAHISAERYTITAADINSEMIAQASGAIYNDHNLHRMPQQLISSYFTKTENGQYILDPQITAKVRFKHINILDQNFTDLGKFDYIFCRNMLIYMNDQSCATVECALDSVLNGGGMLFLGHADPFKNHIGYTRHFSRSVLYYEKPEIH